MDNRSNASDLNKIISDAIDLYNADSYLSAYVKTQTAMQSVDQEQQPDLYFYCELVAFDCRLALSLVDIEQASTNFDHLKQKSSTLSKTQLTSGINAQLKRLTKTIGSLNDGRNQADYLFNYALLIDETFRAIDAAQDEDADDHELSEDTLEKIKLLALDEVNKVDLLKKAIEILGTSYLFYEAMSLKKNLHLTDELLASLHESLADLYVDNASNEHVSRKEQLHFLNEAIKHYENAFNFIEKYSDLYTNRQFAEETVSLYLSFLHAQELLAKLDPENAKTIVKKMETFIKEKNLENLIGWLKDEEEKEAAEDKLKSHQKFCQTTKRNKRTANNSTEKKTNKPALETPNVSPEAQRITLTKRRKISVISSSDNTPLMQLALAAVDLTTLNQPANHVELDTSLSEVETIASDLNQPQGENAIGPSQHTIAAKDSTTPMLLEPTNSSESMELPHSSKEETFGPISTANMTQTPANFFQSSPKQTTTVAQPVSSLSKQEELKNLVMTSFTKLARGLAGKNEMTSELMSHILREIARVQRKNAAQFRLDKDPQFAVLTQSLYEKAICLESNNQRAKTELSEFQNKNGHLSNENDPKFSNNRINQYKSTRNTRGKLPYFADTLDAYLNDLISNFPKTAKNILTQIFVNLSHKQFYEKLLLSSEGKMKLESTFLDAKRLISQSNQMQYSNSRM